MDCTQQPGRPGQTDPPRTRCSCPVCDKIPTYTHTHAHTSWVRQMTVVETHTHTRWVRQMTLDECRRSAAPVTQRTLNPPRHSHVWLGSCGMVRPDVSV